MARSTSKTTAQKRPQRPDAIDLSVCLFSGFAFFGRGERSCDASVAQERSCWWRRGCIGGGVCFANVYPRVPLGPQRPLALARPLSPALRAGDKPTLVSWFGFADQRRGSCCATSPLLTAFGRTPATHVAPPRGWLFSSAFLASMVRVHGDGGRGQQEANSNVPVVDG